MGQCAVCGDTFVGGVIKDMMGMESGIQQFSVGFVEQMLYCHAPKCKDALCIAFAAANDAKTDMEGNKAVCAALPDGPLKEVLTEAIERLETET